MYKYMLCSVSAWFLDDQHQLVFHCQNAVTPLIMTSIMLGKVLEELYATTFLRKSSVKSLEYLQVLKSTCT